ncbi:hypothetical protein [Streptomyces clavuligerus]|uniref:4Fe-4S Wbl-type domain-containing protein n=1 Tax=Streptomyces clavuligerus TaxID=1901 RepID=D5SIJ6_STRCL|nr:hypothetical protein [Streptomyces clavuligerus]EFG03739.1 Hypothetical protein SCLAV_p0248 [Streptomyces clavuligerus]WDN56439.1 hypothetical protein LL058_31870 [Streptomyces clavuligerus]
MTTAQDPSQAGDDTALKTAVARRARRARRAVRTVVPAVRGVAACTGRWKLFDAAENTNPPPAVRIEAAAICAACPLRATCGFRVTVRARDLPPTP